MIDPIELTERIGSRDIVDIYRKLARMRWSTFKDDENFARKQKMMAAKYREHVKLERRKRKLETQRLAEYATIGN